MQVAVDPLDALYRQAAFDHLKLLLGGGSTIDRVSNSLDSVLSEMIRPRADGKSTNGKP